MVLVKYKLLAYVYAYVGNEMGNSWLYMTDDIDHNQLF